MIPGAAGIPPSSSTDRRTGDGEAPAVCPEVRDHAGEHTEARITSQ